jgi:hypothetical protein
MVEGYRHFNKNAKALVDLFLYIKVKLYALIGYNQVK